MIPSYFTNFCSFVYLNLYTFFQDFLKKMHYLVVYVNKVMFATTYIDHAKI